MAERCTVRQLGTAVFVALLAPASTLPAAAAGLGPLCWLAPLLLFPLAALAARLLGRLEEGGLAAGLKGPLGRLALTLYYVWALALSALTAGGCVDRLSRTDYAWTPRWLLALTLAGVCAYLVCRGAGAFLRAAQIFFLALLAVLALLCALGAANLEPANLAPRGWGDAAGAVRAVLPAGGSLSVAALALFLPRRRREPGESPVWRWLLGWCVAAAGLSLLVMGTLGHALAQEAPLPFFLALQGLGFPGGLQRLEALVTAAWVLSDLTLLGLAALACREMAGDRAWAALPPLAAAALGGWALPNALTQQAGPFLLAVNLALGGVLPVLLALGKGRGRDRAGGISCG